MKNSILILFFLMFAGTQANAKIRVGKSEKLKVVHDFPNTEDYMSNPSRFMDLGILYETFDIFGMPLWVTKDPVFIGLENHNTTVYFDLDNGLINELVNEHKLDRENLKSLSFFDKHLGFLVVLGFIIVVFLHNIIFKSKQNDITNIEEESVKPEN